MFLIHSARDIQRFEFTSSATLSVFGREITGIQALSGVISIKVDEFQNYDSGSVLVADNLTDITLDANVVSSTISGSLFLFKAQSTANIHILHIDASQSTTMDYNSSVASTLTFDTMNTFKGFMLNSGTLNVQGLTANCDLRLLEVEGGSHFVNIHNITSSDLGILSDSALYLASMRSITNMGLDIGINSKIELSGIFKVNLESVLTLLSSYTGSVRLINTTLISQPYKVTIDNETNGAVIIENIGMIMANNNVDTGVNFRFSNTLPGFNPTTNSMPAAPYYNVDLNVNIT